jgi:hypothetical protein
MLKILWTIAVVFFILWILGFALHVTLGGLIHVFLVAAIISVLVRIVLGRRLA